MESKIPVQSAGITDATGRIARPWWQFLSGISKAVNAKRCTASSASYTLTDTIDDTVMATIPVVIGTRGILRLTLAFTMTASADTKTIVVSIDESTAQTYTLDNATSGSVTLMIVGTGNSAQTSFTSATRNASTTSGSVATTENMASSTNLIISATLQTITDSVTLDCWTLEVEQN